MDRYPLRGFSRLFGGLGRHRLRTAVVGIAIMGSVAATVIVLPLSGLFRATRLSVSITDLPVAHPGNVSVTGPGGYARHLTSSAVLAVSPGHYTVTSKPITAGTDRYFTTTSALSVDVRSGTTASAVMDYYDIVPATTVELPPSVIPTIQATTPTSLTLSTPTSGVTPGDVVFVPSTPQTPDGLLVKVATVQSAGGVTSLTTTPATLPEALPQGQINATVDLATAVPSVAETTADRIPAAPWMTLDSSSSPLSFSWAPDYTLTELEQLGCVGPDSLATAAVDPSVAFSLQPTLHLEADWHVQLGSPPLVVHVSAYVTVTEQFNAGVRTTAAFTCTLPYSSPAVSLAHIPLDVAGFPVIITPQLSWLASASATIAGAAQFGVNQTASAMGGLSYSTQSGFQLLHSLTSNWNVDSSGSVSGSATLSTGPQLVFDIDGQGGPSLGLTGALTAAVGTSPLSAALTGELSGTVGIDLDIFGVVQVDDDVHAFDVSTQLWHATAASAGPPSTSSASQGGPGSSSSPPPTPTPSAPSAAPPVSLPAGLTVYDYTRGKVSPATEDAWAAAMVMQGQLEVEALESGRLGLLSSLFTTAGLGNAFGEGEVAVMTAMQSGDGLSVSGRFEYTSVGVMALTSAQRSAISNVSGAATAEYGLMVTVTGPVSVATPEGPVVLVPASGLNVLVPGQLGTASDGAIVWVAGYETVCGVSPQSSLACTGV
jgi:hypothetical protein